MGPIGIEEGHIRIHPRDVLPVMGQAADCLIDHALFVPEFIEGPELDMAGVIPLGNLEWPISKGQFHHRQPYIFITAAMLFERLVEIIPALEAQRIEHHCNDMQGRIEPLNCVTGVR